MFKIVSIVDKKGTAIDRLAQGVAKYHDSFDYKVVDVHPKRPDPIQLERFEQEAIDADIIDFQYFRTAQMLLNRYDWLAGKKKILTHYNPYSINEDTWNDFDLVIACNKEIYTNLGKITEKPVEYSPLTVDTDFWTYNTEWSWADPKKNNQVPRILMVANRIESKKGILPVAIACGELGYKFIIVGNVSDGGYMEAILQTGNVEFHENISDEKLKELYYTSTVHVCNSVDGFESGTLPILEAMLCGTPVMTRKIGHVPELHNKENLCIYEGDNEDVLAIRDKLLELVSDKKGLEVLRDKAWASAKVRSNERRAYFMQKLYRGVMYPDQTSVSVVLPVYENHEVMRKCFDAIANQTYKNIEVVVVNDNYDQNGQNQALFKELAEYVNIPVKYFNTSKVYAEAVLTDRGQSYELIKDYGLARARNIGTIEATGEVVVYCDQRMIMEETAIEEFVKYLKPKHWLWGNKGYKKDFLENFSCAYRSDAIISGLFSERMDRYGGLSQEIRSRIRAQGIATEYVESAKCIPTGKSANRNRKRNDILKIKNKLWKMELE